MIRKLVLLLLVGFSVNAHAANESYSLSSFPQNEVLIELNEGVTQAQWLENNPLWTSLIKKAGKPSLAKTFSHLETKGDTKRLIELRFFQPFDVRWKARQMGQNNYPFPSLHNYITATFPTTTKTNLATLIDSIQSMKNVKAVYPNIIKKIQASTQSPWYEASVDWIKPWLKTNGWDVIATLDMSQLLPQHLSMLLTMLSEPYVETLTEYDHQKDSDHIYFKGLKEGISRNQFDANDEEASNYAEGKLLIKFKPGTSTAKRKVILDSIKATEESHFYTIDTYSISFPTSQSIVSVLETLSHSSDVWYAEPSYLYELNASNIPNDPVFDLQFGLLNDGTLGTTDKDMDAELAWGDYSTGGRDVIIAMIDSGIAAAADFFEDPADSEVTSDVYKSIYTRYLNSNLYINETEVLGYYACWLNLGPSVACQKDYDSNGVANDWYGYDAIDDEGKDMYSDSGYKVCEDDPSNYSHGTFVASIIAAYGNNKHHMTGVNWRANLMPIKTSFCSDDEKNVNSVDAILKGVEYAAGQGAKIVNMSLGGSDNSASTFAALNSYPSVLFFASAGNESQDNSVYPHFPSNLSITMDNMIAVGGYDPDGYLGSTSNYSTDYVQISALSEKVIMLGITSLEEDTDLMEYMYKKGTSLAAPFVSGAAANILHNFPAATAAEVKECLLEGADNWAELDPYIQKGRAVNLKGALDYCNNLIGYSPTDEEGEPAEDSECEKAANAITNGADCMGNASYTWDPDTSTCHCTSTSGAAGHSGEKGGFQGCQLSPAAASVSNTTWSLWMALCVSLFATALYLRNQSHKQQI